MASTSGSDSDWVVKLIDVYPEEMASEPAMGGYQFPVAMDIFRGRYRESFSDPKALTPNTPLPFRFILPTANHAFQPGHRIMVQVQSKRFPLYDRNPQTFVPNIFFARAEEYVKATQRVYRAPGAASFVELGQAISLIGSWMTRLATAWLVYRLTDSAFLLGVVSFAGQVPSMVLPPLVGVWVDRWDRRNVLIATQVSAMLQSLALAALTLSGYVNMPWIIGLTLFQGVVNAVEIPTRQSFVVRSASTTAPTSATPSPSTRRTSTPRAWWDRRSPARSWPRSVKATASSSTGSATSR